MEQYQRVIVYIYSILTVLGRYRPYASLVRSNSMCHLTVMPISGGRAVQEGAKDRPEGPHILRYPQSKGPPPTSWTWRLHDSFHCFLSRVGPEEQVGQQVGQQEDFPGIHRKQCKEPAFFTSFYRDKVAKV